MEEFGEGVRPVGQRRRNTSRVGKCKALSRRNKYAKYCNSYAMRNQDYCYFHTKYEPFKELHEYTGGQKRPGENTKIVDRIHSGTYDTLFLTFCLRIIKDSVRKIQIPIDVDLTTVRVDVDNLYIVYLVVEEPQNRRVGDDIVNVKWPLKIILTNIFKFDDGHRNETQYSFDVFMPQYNVYEYVWARNVFRQVFIRELNGHQIFNCKYAHYSPFRLNVSISPFIFDTNEIPIDLLCLFYVKRLAKEAYHVRRSPRQWVSRLSSDENGHNVLKISELIQKDMFTNIESVLSKSFKESMSECSQFRPLPGNKITEIKAAAANLHITHPIIIDTRAGFYVEVIPLEHIAAHRNIKALLDSLRADGIDWFLQHMMGDEEVNNEYPAGTDLDLGIGVTLEELINFPQETEPAPLNSPLIENDNGQITVDTSLLDLIGEHVYNDINQVMGRAQEEGDNEPPEENYLEDGGRVFEEANYTLPELTEEAWGELIQATDDLIQTTDDLGLGYYGVEHGEGSTVDSENKKYWNKLFKAYGSCMYSLED